MDWSDMFIAFLVAHALWDGVKAGVLAMREHRQRKLLEDHDPNWPK